MQKFQETVDLTPVDHPLHLQGLAVSLSDWYNQSRDLEATVYRFQEAVDLTPADHPDRLWCLQSLGGSLRDRYWQLGDWGDYEAAIRIFQETLDLVPVDYADRPGCLQNLARSFSDQYRKLGDPKDLENVHHHYAASFTTFALNEPEASWRAALIWAQFSNEFEVSFVFTAYKAAFQLLPEILWMGNTIPLKFAVEILEQGLGITFQQILQLKPDVDKLLPEQAAELQQFSFQLYSGTAVNPREVAAKRKHLLDVIHKQPGLDYFMLPKPYSALAHATHQGPVVILNSDVHDCDGIIILNPTSEPVHVSFSSVTLEQLHSWQNILKKLLGRCNVRTRDGTAATRLFGHREGFKSKAISECFEALLTWLWKDVVDPVYQVLASHGRLWWLPTATLGSLLESQSKKEASSDPGKVGVVGVTHTGRDGKNYLKGVKQEIQKIGSIIKTPGLQCLEGEHATPDAVKLQLEDCSWVHLACHGTQDLVNPTKSRLLLYEGSLDLETILQMPLPNAEFVFLAACQTVMGDADLVNESFHLGGGYIAAGFRSAIGTLWSMNDEDGSSIHTCFAMVDSPMPVILPGMFHMNGGSHSFIWEYEYNSDAACEINVAGIYSITAFPPPVDRPWSTSVYLCLPSVYPGRQPLSTSIYLSLPGYTDPVHPCQANLGSPHLRFTPDYVYLGLRSVYPVSTPVDRGSVYWGLERSEFDQKSPLAAAEKRRLRRNSSTNGEFPNLDSGGEKKVPRDRDPKSSESGGKDMHNRAPDVEGDFGNGSLSGSRTEVCARRGGPAMKGAECEAHKMDSHAMVQRGKLGVNVGANAVNGAEEAGLSAAAGWSATRARTSLPPPSRPSGCRSRPGAAAVYHPAREHTSYLQSSVTHHEARSSNAPLLPQARRTPPTVEERSRNEEVARSPSTPCSRPSHPSPEQEYEEPALARMRPIISINAGDRALPPKSVHRHTPRSQAYIENPARPELLDLLRACMAAAGAEGPWRRRMTGAARKRERRRPQGGPDSEMADKGEDMDTLAIKDEGHTPGRLRSKTTVKLASAARPAGRPALHTRAAPWGLESRGCARGPRVVESSGVETSSYAGRAPDGKGRSVKRFRTLQCSALHRARHHERQARGALLRESTTFTQPSRLAGPESLVATPRLPSAGGERISVGAMEQTTTSTRCATRRTARLGHHTRRARHTPSGALHHHFVRDDSRDGVPWTVQKRRRGTSDGVMMACKADVIHASRRVALHRCECVALPDEATLLQFLPAPWDVGNSGGMSASGYLRREAG
ncbi:CHAT domain-containing protein [Mycena maculata]|uniref:CHAT domain-containing protein n=1 Tax=Mycena maculata TaxID=230809 RepID=A0AAD7NBZ3_9AGAR|nr:CHAT domain-containing protein [Mycena maculata]